MCAIIGVLGKVPNQDVFEKARDTMAHRGPDDIGLYYRPDEGVALGHRRLSIMDLSPAGHQPFVSNGGRYVLVHNGEIYNFLELKKELQGSYEFKTRTDTEVIIAAYQKWGHKCIKKFNGMFAFAVWDRKERTLFVVRDRLGIKPLYYVFKDGNFYFSSEIKGLLVLPGIERKLNKQGLLDYLSYRYVLGEKTFFEGIHVLLPGHYIILGQRRSLECVRYWDLPVVADKKDPGMEEVMDVTRELLTQAVRYRMMGDAPIGAYLSGGIDSSVVVALMSSLSCERVKTFSVGFGEEEFDEFPHARKVSRIFQTDHHELILKGEDYFELLPEVIRFKDAPLSIPNEVPLYLLSRELKKYISVVLSGEGADELFGGYGRIFRSGYDFQRLSLLADPSYLLGDDRNVLEHNLMQKYQTLHVPSEIDHFLSQYSYFNILEKQQLLNPAVVRGGDLLNKPYFRSFFSKLAGLHTTEKYMYLFQKIHLLCPLRRLDASTMAGSVEDRVPFVDHNLVEYVSSLPLDYKLTWKSKESERLSVLLNSDQISEVHDITKHLLREIASQYLPGEITGRKKIGFAVPLHLWDGLYSSARDMLLSKNARSRLFYNQPVLREWLNAGDALSDSRHGLNVWMLLNMEIWMREYNITL